MCRNTKRQLRAVRSCVRTCEQVGMLLLIRWTPPVIVRWGQVTVRVGPARRGKPRSARGRCFGGAAYVRSATMYDVEKTLALIKPDAMRGGRGADIRQVRLAACSAHRACGGHSLLQRPP